MTAEPPDTSPRFGHLTAPAAWQQVDLISDLHLQANEPVTFEAWRHYMAHTQADAVLVLGDLFEVWVGDDAALQDPFLKSCAQVLRQAAQRLHLAFMPGNRDFLVGSAFLSNCGVHALRDPSLLLWGSQRIVLTHGDALCLDDAAYQRFRQQVRQSGWQTEFLAKPLSERLALARAMRQQSESQKHAGQMYADADPKMAMDWLTISGATRLVHGHTHQPADHRLGQGQRHVLSDWSLDHSPRRAEVFRLRRDGAIERLNLVKN